MIIEINLLPSDLRRKVKTDRKWIKIEVPRYVPYVVVSAVLLAAVISFAVLTYRGSVKGNLKRAKNILAEEKLMAARAITLSTQMPEFEQRASSLIDRVNGKIQWWEILDQITRCCPSNAVLKSIKVNYGPKAEKPDTLLLTGWYEGTTGLEIIFTRNLKSSAKLGTYIDKIYPGQTTTVGEKTEFTVKCTFKQPNEEDDTTEGRK